MRFLSYNLRNARIREDAAAHGWDYRREGVVGLIKKENPDVLGLQEDSAEQLEYIRDGLRQSYSVFLDPVFYEADTAYNAILVRKKLEVAGSGAFWISGNGKTQSRIDGSICFRHATFVRLKQPVPLLVVNVHLDHTDDRAVKKEEMRVFIELLGEIAGRPPARTILMGDFNDVPTTGPHSLLEKSGMYDSAGLRGSAEGTFSCWTKDPPSARIDYIWLSNDLKGSLKTYRVSRGVFHRPDGSLGYGSDHAAVSVQLDI